jgi:4-amino-4-deoxy-L-arabinose transferase-like glycosyltransferase
MKHLSFVTWQGFLGLALAGVATALYTWHLGTVPIFVGGDETYFGENAHQIASTGRDLAGRLIPLFFEIDSHTWYRPMLVYLIVPAVKLLGVSEWSIRLPTALIGIVNIALIYAVGLKLFRSAWYAGPSAP